MFEDEETVPIMSKEEIDLRNELNREVFGGEEASELPPENVASEDVEIAKDDDKQTEEAPDPWKDVSPVIRQAIVDINSKLGGIDGMEGRLKQAESRVGGIDNRLRDLKAAFPASKQPTKQEVEAALASNEGWKTFSLDFPDHATAFKDILIATGHGAGSQGIPVEEVERIRAEMKTDFDEKLNKQQLAFELKLLRMMHKDHKTLVNEPEFMPWLKGQPQETQDQYGSWDALDGIDLLDKYKSHKAAKAALPDTARERQERLNLSAETRKSTQALKVKSEAEMTEAEYRNHISKQIWGK